MKACSFLCESSDDLKKRILHHKANSFQPNLALVFCSSSQDLDDIRAIFTAEGIDLAGCTTAGEIVDAGLYEKSIAVMLFSLDRAYYRVLLEKYEGEDVGPAAESLGKQAVATFANPSGIILSGGLTVDAELIIENIYSGAEINLPMYGGMAGDDLEMRETIVFSNTMVSSQGLLLLVLDADHVKLEGMAVSGWSSIGGVNTISKAEGNVIYEINGERAYDVFMRYFGSALKDPLISIQTNYPLQIIREGGNTVLRSPIFMNEKDGSITLTAGIKRGEEFRFSSSPDFEVIDTTIAAFGKLQEAAPVPDAVILFSCKGRHGAFGPLLEDEVVGIFNRWEKPMIGLLSYGEFGENGHGRCEFYNSTCSLVTLKVV